MRPAALLALLICIASFAELPALIPREVLLGNPEMVGPSLSPDGSLVAYIAPADDVLNLWLMGRDGSGPRQLTFDTGRGVTDYYWAENGRHIIYMQDEAGEENTHVYLLSLEDGSVTDLTPWEGAKSFVFATDRDAPETILLQSNRNDPSVFDVYSADLTTGEVVLLEENPGWILGWMSDEDMNIRFAFTIGPDGGQMLLERGPDGEWTPYMSWDVTEEVSPVRFSKDGSGMFYTSTLGSDTSRLLYRDFTSGSDSLVASDPLCDVGGVLFDEETVTPRAVSFTYLTRRVELLDESLRGEYEYLAGLDPGEFFIASSDRADSTWIVGFYSISNPVSYYLYDRTAGTARFLFSAMPDLEGYELADMTPVLITARDGLVLPSYLTLPVGLDPEGLPLVLYVHGGPWWRDSYRYDPMVQLFANRGFAVLQVNFRGSTGFGKAFLNASNKEWGGAMQDDLTDAVEWAIAEGYADPERIAIVGGSYGGYATLAGITFTPDLYRAAVDFCGPSNLVTFRETVPAYWRPLDALFDARIGSLTEDREMLEERSPLNHVEAIRTPLLVIQGVNDPRVVQAESDQFVEAVRATGTPVEYVLYDGEGHGFALEANNLDFAGRTEEFLARWIPGVRFEPWTPVPGATARQ